LLDELADSGLLTHPGYRVKLVDIQQPHDRRVFQAALAATLQDMGQARGDQAKKRAWTKLLMLGRVLVRRPFGRTRSAKLNIHSWSTSERLRLQRFFKERWDDRLVLAPFVPRATTRRSRPCASGTTTSALKARARSWLPWTRIMVQHLTLIDNNINKDLENLVDARLGVSNLVLKVASWVASAVGRRVELWHDERVLPPAIAARAAVLAFGDELLDLKLPDRNDQWLSPGGREFAAAYLLPRAEAALRQELQRLADSAKYSRTAQSSSFSSSRAL
jgi:hypothetical protein